MTLGNGRCHVPELRPGPKEGPGCTLPVASTSAGGIFTAGGEESLDSTLMCPLQSQRTKMSGNQEVSFKINFCIKVVIK